MTVKDAILRNFVQYLENKNWAIAETQQYANRSDLIRAAILEKLEGADG